MPRPPRLAALVIVPLLAAAAPAPDGGGDRDVTDAGARDAGVTDAGPADAGVRGPSFRPVEGKVVSVDHAAARITIESAGGPVALGFDRNTAVFVAGHLGTMEDVKPGLWVRASGSPEDKAYWIEIRRSGEPSGPSGGALGGAPPAAPARDGGPSLGDGGPATAPGAPQDGGKPEGPRPPPGTTVPPSAPGQPSPPPIEPGPGHISPGPELPPPGSPR